MGIKTCAFELIFGNLIINLIWYIVGGESTADNCQILQSRVNRLKSDKYNIDSDQLKDYSCEVNFTGMPAFLFVFLCILLILSLDIVHFTHARL